MKKIVIYILIKQLFTSGVLQKTHEVNTMYKHESNTYVGDGYHFNVLVSFNHKTPLNNIVP